MTATMQVGLTKPSEITEPGWYWAEEASRLKGQPVKYSAVMLRAQFLMGGVMNFTSGDDLWEYDAAAADRWFRIIRRIDEPEITGGWG